MQPLISVIVPVYKVEPYLDQCVNSIVNQTYTNLEIILVDDGSPDNCPQMCDDWAKKDSRIKVIHKENGGLSDARNAGLAIASGEYIGFVDSDDWISHIFFEKLYEPCQKYGCEISACDVLFTDERTLDFQNNDIKAVISTPENALWDIVKGKGYRAVVWNKLYKAPLIKHERFVVGKYHEDEFFTYRILAKASKLAYYSHPLYFYFQNINGIVHSASLKHLDALEAYTQRLNFFENHFSEIFHYDRLTVHKAIISYYAMTFSFSATDKKISRKFIRKQRRSIHFNTSDYFKYNLKDALIIFSSRHFLHILSLYIRSRKEIK